MLTHYTILIFLFISGYCSTDVPVVKTPLGTISGYIKSSLNGRKFAAFEGIPYAKPPIGQKRFEEPEPIEPWEGTWKATLLTVCAQTVMTQQNTTAGDEDCLYVNVYVPKETPNPNDKLEVVVHIHGGAYMYGSGHYYSPPEYVMDKDLIFVTFNYRLGVFGFLSTEDDVVPGNNGLKDQAVALKWIKENIASFGGNPNSITLTGLSAGGSSVHLHYFSEWSKGLFQRGFSQSGLALNPWSIGEEPLSKAKKLGDALGCPTECTKKLVKCLKQKQVQHILDKVQLFFSFKFMPAVPFGPVVEKAGSRPFLNKDPYELLKEGKVLDVPWLASVTTHEGIFPVLYFLEDLEYVGEHWNELAPTFFDFNYTLPKSEWDTTSEKIKEHYFGKEKITKENMFKLIQVFSDRFFLAGAESAVKLQAKVNKSPVYFYFFNYVGDNNPINAVGHGAEIKYMWKNVFSPIPTLLTSNEVPMKDALWDMVHTYGKTGEPVFAGVKLEPTEDHPLTYYKINGHKPEEIKRESIEEDLTNRSFWKDLHFSESETVLAKDEL